MKQLSPEWIQARLGKCTGSRVKDAIGFLKNGEPSSGRKRYMVDLACERMTGSMATHYVNDAMIWGQETEALARTAYEMKTGNDVDLIGLAEHPTIANFSASPDGLIGSDGLFEAKCPMTATHIDWMLAGVVPKEHELQCMAQMACTGRKWVDFVSYDPRLPLRHQLMVVRLERDDARIAEMEAGVIQFLAEVDALIAELNARNPEIADQPKAIAHPEDYISDEELARYI